MAGEPPYIYQRPSSYVHTDQTGKGYNPKGVTQASWVPRVSPPKAEGPLIDAREFNKHPDSYMVVPYGNLNWQPMSKHTKTKVNWTRGMQLFSRILELLGALGLLFCVICIRPIGTSLDWIIRVAPAVGILHTLYAIYHLSRSCKDRTPTSTASYMIFAAITDASILPFLAFTAFMSYQQHVQATNTAGAWKTLFGTEKATEKIIYSTYLICVVDGALHVASLTVSLYLAIMFRKISHLPPDMNPLEPNLTSRRSHKRNKSSMSVATTTTGSPSNRNSAQPLMEDARKVPFMHTRDNSQSTFSVISPPTSPQSPHRASRTDLYRPGYEGSPRASQSDFRTIRYPNSSPTSARSSRTDLRRSPEGPPRTPLRQPGMVSQTSFVTAPSPSNAPRSPRNSRPISSAAGHVKRDSLYHGAPAEDNWFAKGEAEGVGADDGLADHSGLHPPELQHLRAGSREHTPELVLSPQVVLPMPQKAGYEFMDENARSAAKTKTRQGRRMDFTNRSPRPLGMHPPTPPTQNVNRTPTYTPAPLANDANPYRPEGRERRALGEVGGNANAGGMVDGSPATFEEIRYMAGRKSESGDVLEKEESVAFLDVDTAPKGTSVREKARFYGSLKDVMGGGKRQGGRAVSTGLDEALVPPTKGLRGREVSGKVAEEGRA